MTEKEIDALDRQRFVLKMNNLLSQHNVVNASKWKCIIISNTKIKTELMQ